MIVYELTMKVFLLQNIHNNNALEKLSEIIDKSLSKDNKFLEFHNVNNFKYYTFNSLYPIEKDKVYKKGNIYSVRIHTVKKNLVEFFKKNLVNEHTDYIKALTIECKSIKKKHIEKIYSITPVVIKTDSGYWRNQFSIELYERRLKENLIKKYNSYFDTKIDEDFELFTMFKFENKKPITTSYKNINFLGDKVSLFIAENKTAQDLAYFALGTGIGEINSRGFGYIHYKNL